MPVYLGQFTDSSKYYITKVKALRKDEEYPTKVSIEISHKNKTEDDSIRSFRSSNKETIQNLIASLCAAYSYFLADGVWFNNMDGKPLPTEERRVVIEDEFRHLMKKAKVSFGDGIRKYEEGL